MKRLAFLLLFVVVITAENLYTEQQIVETRRCMKECKETTNISNESIEQMMNRNFVDDENTKKYLLCLHKKLHFMEDDGTVNKENLRNFFGQHDLSKETLEKCINKKSTNPDETAYLITKCYMLSLPPNVKGWV